MSDILLNTTLAILAGGEGSRMGQPKGNLTVAGLPILKRILEMAHWAGPTLLVTAPGRESPPAAEEFDAEASDPVAGMGPMRGILTALEHATTEQIIISPVDMPSLGAEVFRWLAEELHRRPAALAVMIERIGDHEPLIEPLPAAFRQSARALIEHRLADGKCSVRQLTDCKHVHLLRAPDNWPASIWTNLNYPADAVQWASTLRPG